MRIVISILLLTLGCNSNNLKQVHLGKDENKFEPCPQEWNATGKELKQVDINDTTEQMYLNDTLWFEVIKPLEYGTNRHKAYIKNYWTNGQLENEGFAIYFEHPIEDYEKHGKWKYYNCKGKLVDTKEFFEGKLVNTK